MRFLRLGRTASAIALVWMLSACTLDFDNVGPAGNGGAHPVGGAPGSGAGGSSTGGDASGGGGNGGADGGMPAGGDGGVGPGGGQTGGTGGTGGAPGPCDATCLGIPGGFEGPVRLEHVASGSTCAAGTLVKKGGLDVGGNITVSANPAMCGCHCDPPASLGCGQITVSLYASSSCATGGIQTQVFDEDMCSLVTGNVLGLYAEPSTRSVSGQCTSDNLPPILPDIHYNDRVLACDDSLPACADDAVCVPADVTYCIYSETAGACPAGFTTRSLALEDADVTDTRDCTCACGMVQGLCENAFDVSMAGCGTGLAPAPNNGGCFAGAGGIKGARYNPTAGSPGCSATTDPQSSGNATLTGTPAVLCCTGNP